MKTAIITGATGQDGYYLTKFLLLKGYRVVGIKRRTSSNAPTRLEEFFRNARFSLVEGDVSDYFSMANIIKPILESPVCITSGPVEIYNLAAQSHVHTSFEQPAYTFKVNYEGVLNILEICRPYKDRVRIYQASTSEMFGDNYNFEPINAYVEGSFSGKYQDENTSFSPMSPYAVSKAAAHYLVNNYRKAYGLHANCGILFNHESPQRGDQFVTQKICKYVAQLQYTKSFTTPREMKNKLKLGNLQASRDWGHASDYVKAMWLMLQQNKPDDYVVATGITHTIEQFLDKAFKLINEDWHNHVEIDQSFVRPSEVPYLCGNPRKIQNLGWTTTYTLDDMIREMVVRNHARI
jgi:GDPmannose 4,6-dehydratase